MVAQQWLGCSAWGDSTRQQAAEQDGWLRGSILTAFGAAVAGVRWQSE